MAKTFWSAFAAVVICLAPRPAMASVMYDFSGSVAGLSFGFVYSSPDFIVPPLTVLAADLDSCDPVAEPPCDRVVFDSTSFTLFSGTSAADFVVISGLPIGYLSTLGSRSLHRQRAAGCCSRTDYALRTPRRPRRDGRAALVSSLLSFLRCERRYSSARRAIHGHRRSDEVFSFKEPRSFE
jgi:hypothetical protein